MSQIQTHARCTRYLEGVDDNVGREGVVAHGHQIWQSGLNAQRIVVAADGGFHCVDELLVLSNNGLGCTQTLLPRHGHLLDEKARLHLDRADALSAKHHGEG